MRSIEKLSQDEKEIKLLIGSLQNVLTDVPYDFEWDNKDEDQIKSEDSFYGKE